MHQTIIMCLLSRSWKHVQEAKREFVVGGYHDDDNFFGNGFRKTFSKDVLLEGVVTKDPTIVFLLNGSFEREE